MTDPNDPDSFPTLTDVIVPGRPPIGRPDEAQADTPYAASAQEAAAQPTHEAAAASQSAAAPQPPATSASAAGLNAREADLIADRMRTRFAGYLRQEARGAIEARCRDAVAEHTNWLVRQVTRDVVTALESEVSNWVRDAVREELARHTSKP